MVLHSLADNKGARHERKRKGRGPGSGTGKTGGRGHKGQKSRSGVAIKGFEGGQMPIHRRLPKRGFNNKFRKEYISINIGRLQKYVDSGKLNANKVITKQTLVEAGLLGNEKLLVKILGSGECKTALKLTVDAASQSATEQIEKLGGKITVSEAKPKKQPTTK